MITTLVFDLGAVVLSNDWHYDCPEKFLEFSTAFGIGYDDMERGWKAHSQDYLLGKMSEDEYWKRFLITAGAQRIDVGLAKRLYRKYQMENENMLGLIRLLKNYRVAALTTIGREWLQFKRRKFQLSHVIEVIVSSGESGLQKPDPRIYKLLLAKLRVPGKECVFIDNSKEYLPPARKLGMKTILFTSRNDCESQLRRLDIKF